MKINLEKQTELSKDEQLRIISQSIINRFQMALSYYYEQIMEHPEIEGLIEL